MQENNISTTGFWEASTAHLHHIHSLELSQWLCDFLDKNTRVVDFGCGLGFYLSELQKSGFTNLVGYEGMIPEKQLFENIISHDLTKPIKESGNVICLEVGEHIPAEYAGVFIDNLCNTCTHYLILSWAVRGQPGRGHVNCLDNHEVVELIEKKGLIYSPKKTKAARSVINENTYWFKDTLLIFEK
jgi:hypothetical protein